MIVLPALFFSPFAWAQEKTSNEYYQDLLRNYRSYQNLLEPFTTQKSRYLAYQTVATQADFLDSSRALILSEIEAISSYSLFIKSLLAEATKILNYKENYLYVQLDDELTYLKLAKERAQNLSSLGETNQLMSELAKHYEKISQIAYQTKSVVVLGSLNKVYDNLKVEREKLSFYLSELTSDTSNIKAAREKFTMLEKQNSEVDEILREAASKQKVDEKGNAKAVSEEIQNLVNEGVNKIRVIISGYQNIVYNLK